MTVCVVRLIFDSHMKFYSALILDSSLHDKHKTIAMYTRTRTNP